ncbi:efflux RND transporter periplasmic adaptor subunit [Undibacterium sp. SXout7W]|uniref:efflux RND transporter periplasmic adaptor subunit n=1 Tax=Undibacterium sp. SXout7W TaxID=3413049 RepID=UPI003BF34CA6
MSTLESRYPIKKQDVHQRRNVSALLSFSLSVAMIAILSACSKPAEKTEDIRPVRVVQVQSGGSEVNTEFSGEVRPRIESRLGFRVNGKIVTRKVNLGTLVRRGQVLMQLDPQDLELAKTQAKAGLAAAESNRDIASAEFKRYQELRSKNFVSPAVLDSKEFAYKAAQSSYEQALAAYKNQSNQSGYATLTSDVDGVVTGIDAEIGQVVSAGTPVIRVAQLGEMDVVVGIPEDKINTIRQVKDITVKTWANPNQVMKAQLRELSPIADPVTRTYIAKVSLPADAKEVRLGMTAFVNFSAINPDAMIRLPVTALFQEKNTTSVWVLDKGTVKLYPVQIGGTAGEDVLIASGINNGQLVVTAGVNLLKSGQKVSILGGEPAQASGVDKAANKTVKQESKAATTEVKGGVTAGAVGGTASAATAATAATAVSAIAAEKGDKK